MNNPMLTLTALTSGSTDGTWTYLNKAYTRFTLRGLFSSGSSGTLILQGALSSDSTATGLLTLVTVDNTTQIGYNSSAVPVQWIRARLTAVSTGGNPTTITPYVLPA